MKTQCHNPYLPLWEHIPDGEPHVFEDRLYIFGSHDLENGNEFCEQDYVSWSAPLDDLSDWFAQSGRWHILMRVEMNLWRNFQFRMKFMWGRAV